MKRGEARKWHRHQNMANNANGSSQRRPYLGMEAPAWKVDTDAGIADPVDV